MRNTTANTLERLFSLERRVGIVTGASSGIGEGIAQVLANAGAKVYDLSRRGKGDIEHTNIVRIPVDITDNERVKKIVDEIGEKEGLDFLINNAGITKRWRAGDVSKEYWDKIHNLNLDAVFHMSQFSYPYLKKSSYIGRIVNISSMAAHLGFEEVVPYCSTKAGVLGITRGLAVEWVNDNILVNSVAPGWIPSQMSIGVMDDNRKEKILSRMALHKFGEPEDIGTMVLYLVSNAGKYITGQDFAVDGGALCYGY
ncbi:SDR family NAD(P)-dependent oxidoreductase [Geosporobacter ferrireducens]|uniref:Short-chain dehydrogenase n=1 Tax=Geosporobacter ferrireducens TaxID=1424294 RepID=A0A1D8GM98_9FIRM|nr:SDR family oxidoreductase [Geosporobacter ferrireducens]AOT72033.1 short-chain dehydrogenase [Geosporobacter ferrireducens]MTI55913.1 SDR family oxidoreductase [Geosporobacter ferrireducens]